MGWGVTPIGPTGEALYFLDSLYLKVSRILYLEANLSAQFELQIFLSVALQLCAFLINQSLSLFF